MNAEIERMFSDAEGRYLEPTEQSSFTQYALSVDKRLKAMRALEEKEAEIIESSLDALWQEMPDFKTRHPHAREKAVRDMTLVYRYAALAMVRNDETFLTQKLSVWFRTLVQAFDMSQALQFVYARLIDETQSRLSADDFELIAPYLKSVHHTLSN